MTYRAEAGKLLTAAVLSVTANFGVIAFSRRTAEITPQFEPLTYASVGLATTAAATAAYITLQILKKYTQKPLEYFYYISGLTLIASFGPIGHIALNLPNAGTAEINILGLTHVIAAVIIIGTLAKLEQKY